MAFRRLVFLATLLVATSAAAAPPGVTVFESPMHPHTTEGDVTIEADPAVAFATTTDYAHWPSIFTDLVIATITRQDGADADVVVRHRDGSADHLRFHKSPGSRTLRFEQVDGDAQLWAELSFTAGQRANTTRIHTLLHAEASGVAGWFTSDGALRALRQQAVRDDLTQLQTFLNRAR
jgi:hypothetical protein